MAKTNRVSEITIYNGVPFDSYTNDIIWFDSIEHQNAFWGDLNGWLAGHFRNLQAIFEGRRVKLPITFESALQCNYLRYKNPDFGDKWFYCFVTSVEYISNAVTEFVVLPDILQTHMFDFEFTGSTHIIRTIVGSDSLGKYDLEELPVSTDMVYDEFTSAEILGYDGNPTESYFKPDNITILSTADPSTGGNVTGGEYEGIYSGAKRFVYDSTAGVNNAISSLTVNNKSSSVVSVCVTPSRFITADGKLSPHYIGIDTSRFTNLYTENVVFSDWSYTGSSTEVDHYHPHNWKTIQYPYVSMYLTDFQGNDTVIKLEEFANASVDHTARFFEIGTFNGTFEGGIYPSYYQGVVQNYGKLMPVKCGTPCCWTYDAYQAELAEKYADYRAKASAIMGGLTFISNQLAQNTNQGNTISDTSTTIGSRYAGSKYESEVYTSKGISKLTREGMIQAYQQNRNSGSTVANSVIGATAESVGVTNNIVSGLLDSLVNFGNGALASFDSYKNSVLSYMKTDAMPLSCNGNPQPSLFTSIARKGNSTVLHFYCQHIRPQLMRQIDRFFTFYGYNVNAYGTPTIYNRNVFDYLQTDKCKLKRKAGAKITQEELNAMGIMFDNGVRFWHCYHTSATTEPTTFTQFTDFLDHYRCVYQSNNLRGLSPAQTWSQGTNGYIDRYGEPTNTKPTDWS